MKPRRDRWLSLTDIGERLAERYPRVAKLNRKCRNEYAKRLVERIEQLDGAQYTKRVGMRVYVRLNALEALLPPDVNTTDSLSENMSLLNQQHRDLLRKLNDQSYKLRKLDERVSIVEEKQEATQDYLLKLNEIEGRKGAA